MRLTKTEAKEQLRGKKVRIQGLGVSCELEVTRVLDPRKGHQGEIYQLDALGREAPFPVRQYDDVTILS